MDVTGVGRAVWDLLWDVGLPADLVGVTITGGTEARRDPGGAEYHVPKRDLVGTLRVLLDAGRLELPAQAAKTQALVNELRSFRVKIGRALRETFEHREDAHDDLVLAVAVATWTAKAKLAGVGVA